MTSQTSIHPFFDPNTGTVSYVIAESSGKHAAIVDPVLDFDFKSARTATTAADKILSHVRSQGLIVDWILETHAHADHLHGLDDLRMISQLAGHAIPFYSSAAALKEAEQRFGYAFRPVTPGKPVYRPALEARVIEGRFEAAGIPVAPFWQSHGFSQTLGFRIGPVGYSTDVVELDDDAFAALAGIELWVVDCLRREPHPTHATLGKVLGWVERLRPRRTVLTHMDQSLDYRELSAELPPGIEPGHDGLVIELPEP